MDTAPIATPTENDPTTPQDERRAATLDHLRAAGVVGVVRTRTVDQARAAAHALIAGGLTVVEITLTVPAATALINELSAAYTQHEKILIGAGTVLTMEDAQAALAGGARFLVSPVAPPSLAEEARRRGAAVILGGLTPTEVVTALGLGADMVKVFPVASLGGPRYIRTLLGPFPDLPLMVSGGTTLADLAEYRMLGVQTVALADALLPPDLVNRGDWEGVTALARQAVELMRRP
jgi:2-dehydro-3-deoxyphosphogluconate aldolase/(4S)-4-hydroxy-2-oxoglutarate aldolase